MIIEARFLCTSIGWNEFVEVKGSAILNTVGLFIGPDNFGLGLYIFRQAYSMLVS